MLARILVLLLVAGSASAELRGFHTTPQGTGPCGSSKKNAVAPGQQVRLEAVDLPASQSFTLIIGNEDTEMELGTFSPDGSGKFDATVTVPANFPVPNLVAIRGTIAEEILVLSDILAVVNSSQCDMSWASSSSGCADFDLDGVCNEVDECPWIPNPCPTGPACSDGVDNDLDGRVDFGPDPLVNDLGCTSASDTDEKEAGLECDDGIDNDGDGFIDVRYVFEDFGPGVELVRSDTSDPACLSASSPKEGTQCNDGIDNDSDGGMDFDGRLGTLAKDPECRAAWWDDETTVPEPGGTLSTLVATASLAGLARRRFQSLQ